MAKKTTTKPKDTTPKHVKNTQTGVEQKAGLELRWYHIVSTVVVLVLVAVALVRIFSHFDLSLVSSRYTVKYALGCTTSITGKVERSSTSYRYAGASNGMMFGKNGVTNNADEAYLKIIELSDGRAKIEKRNYVNNDWEEQEIRFNRECVVTTEQAPDCMPGISYSISQ